MLLPCISVVDVKTTCFILFYWLMLLPIFLWQMLWPHIIAQNGSRCYCQVADEIAIVGWDGIKWLMLLPQGRCYSHGSMILFKFQFWDVKQNLIPYMWQMVFANVSIQGWIVDPDV